MRRSKPTRVSQWSPRTGLRDGPDERFDELISGWLEETAPQRLPERVLSATFERTRRRRQQVGWRVRLGRPQMPRFVAALGSAAVIVVAAALTLNVLVNPQRAGGPPSSDAPSSSQEPDLGRHVAAVDVEEVHAAQERADAGDPDYTWQVDPQLFTDGVGGDEPGQIEIVDRFLREVLGWEAYVLNPWAGMVRDGVYDVLYDQRYLRCAPGEHEPAVPPALSRKRASCARRRSTTSATSR